MIYGASTHPVLIKKIKLRIWHLRDEVEAVVAARIKAHREAGATDLPSIEDLIEEYRAKELPSKEEKQGLHLVKEESGEEDPSSEEETSEENASAEDEARGMVQEQNPEEVKQSAIIYQRRPAISDDKIIHAESVLSEIYIDQISFFSRAPFLSGQSIVLEFLVPKRFIVNADVLFCRSFNWQSRIISEIRHPYRVNARYTFLRPGERTLLREFITAIGPNLDDYTEHIMQKAAENTAGEADEGEAGDDFDDFDL